MLKNKESIATVENMWNIRNTGLSERRSEDTTNYAACFIFWCCKSV